jgi:tetratricopeptide (TPR) repeat protein
MKKALPFFAGALSILALTASFNTPDLFTFQSQLDAEINPPLSICGTPDARTIIKIMDTTRQMAPLMENLGKYGMKITTVSERAQLFFNQGLSLYYGFNHLEAYRSFKEAARLDPDCAMAYWGQALSLGPNINLPMNPADTETVNRALQKAVAVQHKSSLKEQALINALSKRYTAEALKDRKPLDEAYAKAMEEVAKKFPEDAEVNTLYAEALMDLHPWDFWKNGEAQPWTSLPIDLIYQVISKYPNHPGANHLNIHILEASPEPDRAIESADKLIDLVPGSGHLVHMPSHIYIRVGRYIDGVESNERAVKIDEAYIAQCKVQGVYPLFYYPHNYHFLLACAQMAGMSDKSMHTSEALKRSIPAELLNVSEFVSLQHWYAAPWYNMVRFGKWSEILQINEPEDSLKYIKSVWHYARGMAFIRMNKEAEAQHELANLTKLIADPFMENTIAGFNSFKNVLSIGENILAAEIKAKRKKYDQAIMFLNKAMEIEDKLLYQEPPDWYHPTRQVFGAILLEAGKPALAEQRFREDLNQYRLNGWSLYGLYQSLELQGKRDEALKVKQEFDTAFAKADITLKSVRY